MTFAAALQASGLFPRDIVADGRWRRCATADHPRKKNGAYILYPDGRGYWRNWATESNLNHWRDDTRTHIASPLDLKRIEAMRERDRQDRRWGIDYARRLWADAKPFRGHAYVERDKGLSPTGCVGLRVWHGRVWVNEDEAVVSDWLLVPLIWSGKLVNVQRISGDYKRFVKHAPKHSASYVLDRPGAALTCVVEGLATGLAVYQSVRHARVIVAFDAGNLLPVLQHLKPTGSVVLAADNDHRTEARGKGNPGREKATQAAEAIGAGVAWPEGIEGSDWADYLLEHGQGAAKRLERSLLAAARYVVGV